MNRLYGILIIIAAIAFATGPIFFTDFEGFRADLYPIPQDNPALQPAFYAFSIWFVIYIWVIVHAVAGAFGRVDQKDWSHARLPVLVVLSLGAFWLPVATRNPVWATVMIFIMLAASVIALMKAPKEERWLAREPIALLTGWITASAFAALGITLTGHGVMMGEMGWAWACILTASVVAVGIHRLRIDALLFPLGVAWAVLAIAIKNVDSHPIFATWCFLTLGGLALILRHALRRNGVYILQPAAKRTPV